MISTARKLFLPALIAVLSAACGPANLAVTPEGEQRWIEMKYLDKRVGRGALDFPAGYMTVQGRDNIHLLWSMSGKDFEYFGAPQNAAAIQEIYRRARTVGFQRLIIRVDGRIARTIRLSSP